MDAIRQDLVLALRRLYARPAATLTILFVLATGIGATLVVAAVVDAVLVRPLDYPEADRLVAIGERALTADADAGTAQAAGSGDWRDTSFPAFDDLRQGHGAAFEQMAGFQFSNAYMTGATDPEQVRIARVTASFFEVMGVAPETGRAFSQDEIGRQARPVLVVSHGLWLRQLGGRPEVLGETVNLDGQPHEIIGVMPVGFEYPSWASAWVPVGDQSAAPRDERNTKIIARMAPDASLAQARAEAESLAARLAVAYPGSSADRTFQVQRLLDRNVGSSRAVLLAILAAVASLLVIVCLNIATLQSAAALDRQREISVRMALGALRGRVLRQLMTENLLLATFGGLLGLLLAGWGLDAAIAFGPESLPRLGEARIDQRLAGLTVLLTGATALLFGLLPSLLASRLAPQRGLRGSRTAAIGSSPFSIRTMLVAAQIALTLAMLLASGMTLRSFRSLLIADLGFDFDRLATIGFVLPGNQYPEAHQRVQWTASVFDAVRQVPGVESVSTINFPPLQGQPPERVVRAPGFQTGPNPEDGLTVGEVAVNTDYFSTAGIPIVAGREIRATDSEGRTPVVIVSQTLSGKLWGDTSPLGQDLLLANPQGEPQRVTVVGIAADVRQAGVAAPKIDQIYRPYAQTAWLYSNLVVRAQDGVTPESLLASVQRAVLSIDPDRPLFSAGSSSSMRAFELAQPRLSSLLLTFFSTFGLLLAAVGIYSVLAIMVRSRHREIGIRLAVGSTPGRVCRLILRHGMSLTVVGIALGIPLAWLVTRLMATQLVGMGAFDAWTAGGCLVLLLAASFSAVLGPALRASQVEPVSVLRAD